MSVWLSRAGCALLLAAVVASFHFQLWGYYVFEWPGASVLWEADFTRGVLQINRNVGYGARAIPPAEAGGDWYLADHVNDLDGGYRYGGFWYSRFTLPGANHQTLSVPAWPAILILAWRGVRWRRRRQPRGFPAQLRGQAKIKGHS